MSERIIIAEDDEDLAFVLREALRRQRYDIDVAPTAGGLLDGLKAAPYDLILLDVRLPDMDGLDAIPRCRELAPDTPIIVMTAHGTRQTAMDAITRGAYDFFTKPLKMDEFQVVVARPGPSASAEAGQGAARQPAERARGAHRAERGAQAGGGHGPPRGADRPDD